MGVKLAEIEEGSPIILHINNDDKSMEIGGVLKTHIKENIALIALDFDTTKALTFEHVQVSLSWCTDNGMPIVWNNIRIVSYKTEYVIQVSSDGVKNNRRNSFRVGVSETARLTMSKPGPAFVTVRDISLSGFSITDRKRELGLEIGDTLSISYEDFGFMIDLKGKVVRIEEHEDMIVYGLIICNMCKDLSAYLNNKQRRHRNN